MNGRNITISLGLILFIILFIILTYILYSVGNISNTDIPKCKHVVKEGFFRVAKWFKATKPASSITTNITKPTPPPNYKSQIDKNLSVVEATIGIINEKIRVFNRYSQTGQNVQTHTINTGIRIEELNVDLDTDSIEKINNALTNYIQVTESNKEHYAKMVNTLDTQVKSIRRMPTTDYNAYVRSGETLNLSVQYIDELNKLTPSNMSPKMIFEQEILNVISSNYGLEKTDSIQLIGDNNITVETNAATVVPVTAFAENNITEFANYGIIIDRDSYDKMNDEMNKFIRESIGSAALTKSLFEENCVKPLKKNNIVTSANLQSTITTLSKYGYNSKKSIFFYMQKFNALNIILNTPEYNGILNSYAQYGNISDLETFLNKCAELKIVENLDETQAELSYNYFMIKHAPLGITTNARLVQYATKLTGFYTGLNKEKYLRFLDMVNSFHLKNDKQDINNPTNKLDEFINTLREVGINTYEDYISVFQYNTDKSTFIHSGNITVKLTTVDVYTFIHLFKTYYNDYRYPPIQKNVASKESNESTPTPDIQFAEKYPAIHQNTIPGISIVQSIGTFLSTFKELKFTQDGCFGYFIQSLLNGPKYMIHLLDRSSLDKETPILYEYYVNEITRPIIQQFTTMTTTSSHNDSVFGIFQQILEPFTQLFKYTFPTIYKETFTDSGKTTAGYLDSIKQMGVSDTNIIPISPTKIVNDNEFFAILSDSINHGARSGQPLTMDKAVELLNFFSSIQLPVTQFDQVLVAVKQFGVTPASMSDFIKQITWCKLGSPNNFTVFLDTLVKLKVTMSTLSNFINDLVQFGFDRNNDPHNKMITYLFFTLDILIKYDITYEYQYDTRNTKISNCLYNLAFDGIKLPLFGNESNNLAIELLKKLNRDVDLYRATNNSNAGKIQLNKNMRDLIIRRSDFFYNSSDTTAFGKSNSFIPTPTPETLSSFPQNLYDALFEVSSLPTFMYEIDATNPAILAPLFNGQPIEVQSNSIAASMMLGETQMNNSSPDMILQQQKMERKRFLFYMHVVAQLPYEKQTIPLPFDYCMISNILTTHEYDQMLRRDGSVLVIRSVMSRLFNKLLLTQRESKRTISAENTSAVAQYNSLVDTVNMVSIFPHYSFYLIAQHIRDYNPRENDPRKCGDPNYRAFMGSTIDPYIVELSKSSTPVPTEYSYTENYQGKRESDSDETPNGVSSGIPHSYDFYNRTTPFMGTSQYASW